MSFDINAEPFYSEPKLFTDVVCQSIEDVQGFKQLCLAQVELQMDVLFRKQVVKLLSLDPNLKPFIKSMKKIEKVELERLTDIYHQILLISMKKQIAKLFV